MYGLNKKLLMWLACVGVLALAVTVVRDALYLLERILTLVSVGNRTSRPESNG